MDFNEAFARVIGIEGRYSNNPDDPGKETAWGVTWPTLREAIRLEIVPEETTIASLTQDQAKAIYKALYWSALALDEFDPSISFQVFDASVNHGQEEAAKLLQRAVGVEEDGNIGPVTKAAVQIKKPAKVVCLVIAYRLKLWTSLDIWPTFGRGWANRAATDLIDAAQDI